MRGKTAKKKSTKLGLEVRWAWPGRSWEGPDQDPPAGRDKRCDLGNGNLWGVDVVDSLPVGSREKGSQKGHPWFRVVKEASLPRREEEHLSRAC